MQNPYNVQDVARFVVNYSSKIGRPVSNLKLQKILYFIQADFLAKLGYPCFEEEIEAWDFGPVVPEVYHEYKIYGSSFIPPIDSYLDDSDGAWDAAFVTYSDKCIANSVDRDRIRSMVKECSSYTASELVDITHSQAPWKKSRYSMNNVISKSSIQDYFTGALANERHQ